MQPDLPRRCHLTYLLIDGRPERGLFASVPSTAEGRTRPRRLLPGYAAKLVQAAEAGMSGIRIAPIRIARVSRLVRRAERGSRRRRLRMPGLTTEERLGDATRFTRAATPVPRGVGRLCPCAHTNTPSADLQLCESPTGRRGVRD